MNWILNQLEKHGRKLIIMDRQEQDEYLTRYYLLHKDGTKGIKFNVFLHQFMASDDPVFHCHPWNWYASLILKGGYHEHTPWGTWWRGPGHFRFTNCEDVRSLRQGDPYAPLVPCNLHWVEIPKKGETWTLFIRGRSVKDWGFMPNPVTGEIIHHEQYLAQYRKSDNKGQM